ncbi:hypothetical protein GCM10023238_05750 [Streptomyces heliomycini]
MEVGPASVAPAAGDTGEVPVGFTNQSAACTLDGFPEVRLAGAGDSATVEVPPAEGATAQKLTLAKGESASFTLTYERGAPGEGAFDAEELRVELSGARSFRWTYGPVAAERPVRPQDLRERLPAGGGLTLREGAGGPLTCASSAARAPSSQPAASLAPRSRVSSSPEQAVRPLGDRHRAGGETTGSRSSLTRISATAARRVPTRVRVGRRGGLPEGSWSACVRPPSVSLRLVHRRGGLHSSEV